MRKKNFAVILLLIMFFGCSSNGDNNNQEISGSESSDNFVKYQEKEIEIIEPVELMSYPDSFYYVLSSDIWNGYIAVVDINQNKCFVLNDSGIITSFGSEGEGPGEFNFMGIGVVKFTDSGEIAIYDMVNGRIQFFSIEGELLSSVVIGTPSFDFDILQDYIVLCPMIGKTEIVVIDRDGKTILDIEGDREVTIDINNLPPPMKLIEITNDGQIFYGFNEDYKIAILTIDDTTKKFFGVEFEPLVFSQEQREGMAERAPEFADKFREFQFPFWMTFYDNIAEKYFVVIATEIENVTIMDVFSKDGKYLKRVQLNNSDLVPTCINDGKIIAFSEDDASIKIFDISEIYN